jgi:hypothetical protein
MTAERVLPRDVYDTLEFSALVYGGMGAGRAYDWPKNDRPWCPLGHADNAGIPWDLFWPHRITAIENDDALGQREKRVPFRQWCKRLNVVRGAR